MLGLALGCWSAWKWMKKRMTFFSFANLSPGAMALDLVGHFAAGLLLGLVYFRGLWWECAAVCGRAAASPRRSASCSGRFVLLGGL